MALPEDFNKIFGSTATGGLTPIGDVNYAKGWEFVGSNPPTKNDFSYLQNLSDLKSQWLYSNKLQRTNPFGDIKSDGAAAISTALTNLGLQTIKPDSVSTKIFSPDLKKFLLVSNTSWGVWDNEANKAIALPWSQGGTGKTSKAEVKTDLGIDTLADKSANTKQIFSDSLACKYGFEVVDDSNNVRVGMYAVSGQPTITGYNGKAIVIPDKAGTMALAGESISSLRLSAPREVTVTAADTWMNFTTSEMVVGIYITPTPGGGAWVLNKVKVATLQAYINGAWVNVTQ